MRLRLILSLIFFTLGLNWAAAQQIISGQPLIGSSATESQTATAADQPLDTGFHILVIGDALGGGLGAGLMRMVELEDGYDVTLRYNEESGIARPEIYDWSETLPKIVDGKTYNAIIVLLGANDRQTIRSGDFRYAFGTPEWVKAYGAQTDNILAALRGSGSKVYWVSLPPMANPDYEAAMQQVTALQKQHVEAQGARFVDIHRAFLAADGSYTDQGADDTGEIRKLRGRDGVSFFKQGNNRLAQLVLEAIKANGGEVLPATGPAVSAAKAAVAGESAIATVEAPQIVQPAVKAAPEKPLFGQFGGDGAEISFRPDDFTVASLAGSGPMETGLAALQALAPPGSAAEKLFVTGQAAAAPAGRADDFSLPP